MRRLTKALKKAKETTGMSSMPSFLHTGVTLDPKDKNVWWDIEKRINFITGGSIDTAHGKKGDK